MKLIIQIPCLNEEKTLGRVLDDLPKNIRGIDTIEYLVLDDGSSDKTQDIARQHGCYVIRNTMTKGLANSFLTGIEKCLELGADIIVNTDGDNQYQGKYIEKLIEPIINKEADLVIGIRDFRKIDHFSAAKKVILVCGNFALRAFSGLKVSDATSGFRAYSREFALEMFIYSNYTYTLETIIQAWVKKKKVAEVPIEVNKPLRKSRLIKNNYQYIRDSLITIFRIYAGYKPAMFYCGIGSFFILLGWLLGIRFLYFFFSGHGRGHMQSLILLTILCTIGFSLVMVGLIGEFFGQKRKIDEAMLKKLRILTLGKKESGESLPTDSYKVD